MVDSVVKWMHLNNVDIISKKLVGFLVPRFNDGEFKHQIGLAYGVIKAL